MHAVTHEKQNLKDKKERKKEQNVKICHLLLSSRRTYEYGADAIRMFGLIMLYLQHIILKLLPYQKQLKHWFFQ